MSIPVPTDPNKKYKVLTFKDGRRIVRMHDFQFPKPLDKLDKEILEKIKELDEEKKLLSENIETEKPQGYMSTRNHNKTLKKHCKDLWCRSYPNHYYFITLTTAEPKTFDELNQMFFTLMQAIRRSSKQSVQYVRVIEPPRKENDTTISRNHIHAILEFFNTQKEFNKKWLKKYWEHGIVDFKKVYDIYGVIEYITSIKPIEYKEAIHSVNSNFDGSFDEYQRRKNKPKLIVWENFYPAKTTIPNFTRIITQSRRFGVKEKYKTELLSYEQITALLEQAKKENKFVRKDGHYYSGGYCMDRVYIKALDEQPDLDKVKKLETEVKKDIF